MKRSNTSVSMKYVMNKNMGRSHCIPECYIIGEQNTACLVSIANAKT